MEAIAKGTYLRCSARKMRQVADMIRHDSVDSAIAQLFSLKKTKKSALMLEKVLQSAVANLREKNSDTSLETESLKISKIIVDAGPHIKRIKYRAQGRGFRIHKKLCHLTVGISSPEQ